MRLKPAGLSLLGESEWLCPDGHTTSSTTRCAGGLAARSLARSVRRRAPAPHAFFRQFFWYRECTGAERPTLAREHLSAAPPHPTAAPRRAAPCTRIKAAAAQKQLPQSSRAQPVCRARRARASGQGAPSNKRLELAAPGGQRRIPFVTNQARRRSSSAIR